MKTLDSIKREKANGEFVKISDGIVHYEIGGPKDGSWIVLIHGFSVPMYAWDDAFESLTKEGFRVLRYDLFGRGYSDRPKTLYDFNLYIRQLTELLSALEINDKVSLVGWSMGGGISAVITAQYPEMVDKAVFIAPVSLVANVSLAMRLLDLPIIGNMLMGLIGEKALLDNLRADFLNEELLHDFVEKFKEQMQIKGFKYAILSTMRNFPRDLSGVYKQIGQQKRSTMLVWGKQDDSLAPFSNHKLVQKAIPEIEFHPINNAKHAVHIEKSDEVNKKLISFLKNKK
jgi:pimeloyl-ACP methyl ester carboxylesterase